MVSVLEAIIYHDFAYRFINYANISIITELISLIKKYTIY